MILLLWCWSGAAEPLADVRRPLGERVVVNWTRLELEVSASAWDPMLRGDNKPLEQAAITTIDGTIGSACAQVQVTADVVLGSLRERIVQEALSAWTVGEGRYYGNGAVEVVGVVELQPMVARWMSERAQLPAPELVSGPTGVVIDARGLGVEPVYAPRIVDEAGQVLFDSVLWRDVAFLRTPVVWVADPAHAQAQRAGAAPAFFVAAAGGLGQVTLSAADAERYRSAVAPTRAPGEGAVVIVVDP